MTRNIAERKYGFRLYQGGVPPGNTIRVVNIPGIDVEACGGTHLNNIKEIEKIRVLKTERIQDGVERLVFASGLQAIRFIQDMEATLQEASKILNVSPENVVEGAKKIISEWKERGRAVDRLKEKIAEYETINILSKIEKIYGVNFLSHSTVRSDVDYLIKLGNMIIKKDPKAVVVLCNVNELVNLVVMAGREAIRLGINAGEVASEMAKAVGGGGGGKPNLGQGGWDNLKRTAEAIKVAKEAVKNVVGR